MNGFRAAVSAVGWLFLTAQQAAPPPLSTNLFAEFQTICLDWDADPDRAAEVALERGYVPANDLKPNDLFQGDSFTVFSKVEQGVEWRVVTKLGRFLGAAGTSFQNRCWVSAEPGDFRRTRAAVGRHLGLDFFSQRDTSVFAWLPTEDGGREPVARNLFESALIRLLREDGLRFVMVARNDDQVVLTYIVPRSD